MFPPFNMIESFSDDVLINRGQRLTLVELLEMFGQLAKIGGDYFLKDIREQCQIAQAVEGVKGLSLGQRYIFC